MPALIAISLNINSTAKYILYAPIILYDLVHLIKYNYSYKIVERFCFILTEAVFITIYTMFLFGSAYITQYNLDFFGLGIIVFIEVLILLARVYSYCKNSNY